jgi:hypothetical protein
MLLLFGLPMLLSWPARVARRMRSQARWFSVLGRDPALSAVVVAAPDHLLCCFPRLAVVVRGETAEGWTGSLLIGASLRGAMELLRRNSFERNTRCSSSAA